VQNLNEDLNDPNVWVYVQGLKNPGLKPFQLEGPPPLKMKSPPGESLSLKALLSRDKYEIACESFETGVQQRKIANALGISLGTVSNMFKKWKSEGGKRTSGHEQLTLGDSEEGAA